MPTKNAAKPIPETEAVFRSLRSIFAPYASTMEVISDEPGKYYLQTRNVVLRGKPVWLGGVEIKKNYVSFHLMPVYMFADLKKRLSPELQKRMQGKSCFNFTKPAPDMFDELTRLTAAGIERFRKMDWSKLKGNCE